MYRVLAHPDIADEIKEELKLHHEELNPLNLKQQVDRLTMQIFKIQRQNGNQLSFGKS